MKRTYRKNYRVVVLPQDPDNPRSATGLGRWQAEMSAMIEKAIRRHVDGVHDVIVEYDEAAYCSCCGREWEENPAEQGIPECCAYAQDEWAREWGLPLRDEMPEPLYHVGQIVEARSFDNNTFTTYRINEIAYYEAWNSWAYLCTPVGEDTLNMLITQDRVRKAKES